MRKLTLLLPLIFVALHAFAKEPYNGWWQKGNAYYKDKAYDSAAFLYEKIAALHPENAVVFYNLGNTYYRLNKVGLATLNYERALRLKPNYKEAIDNLELTQSRIPNRIQGNKDIFFMSWWKSLTNATLAATWAVISILVFLLTLSVIFLKRWAKEKLPQYIPSQTPLILTVVCLTTLIFAYVASHRKLTHDRAVVLISDQPFKQSMEKNDKLQSLVPEGTVVKIEMVKEDFVFVKLPDGRTGWMKPEGLEKI